MISLKILVLFRVWGERAFIRRAVSSTTSIHTARIEAGAKANTASTTSLGQVGPTPQRADDSSIAQHFHLMGGEVSAQVTAQG